MSQPSGHEDCDDSNIVEHLHEMFVNCCVVLFQSWSTMGIDDGLLVTKNIVVLVTLTTGEFCIRYTSIGRRSVCGMLLY